MAIIAKKRKEKKTTNRLINYN